MRNQTQNIIQTYILPIVLAIVILAVSQLITLVSISNILEASGLVAVVIIGLFIGQYVAFKTLRIQERDALYGILSVISSSGTGKIATSAALTQSDVLGLESCAHEVWVYAYDLNYERFDRSQSPFTNAVVTNLARGVKYIYVIPNSPEIILRARRMYSYFHQYAKASKQLVFHIANIPPIFNQFSVTLYNPDNIKPADADVSETATIAVFFPHAKDAARSSDTDYTVPFIAVRESRALEIQEQFEAVLREAAVMTLPNRRS